MAMVGKWIAASLRKVEVSTLRAWKQQSGGRLHSRLQSEILTESHQPTPHNLITSWPLDPRTLRERTLAYQVSAQGANMLNHFSSNGRNEKRRTNTTTNDQKGKKNINMNTNPDLVKPGSVVWLPLHEATTCGGKGCLYTGDKTEFVHSKKRPHIIAQVYFKHYVAIPITSYGNRGSSGIKHKIDRPFHTRVRDSAENWMDAGYNVDTPQERVVTVDLGPDNMPLYVIRDAKHTKKPMRQGSLALMASPVTYNGDIPFGHHGWLDEDSKKRFSARYKKLSDGLKGLNLPPV